MDKGILNEFTGLRLFCVRDGMESPQPQGTRGEDLQ